jgi:hypothetical protein
MIDPISVGIGIVAGAFMPAIGRKIKAEFVKEGTAAKLYTEAELAAAVAAAKTAAASKL